MGSNGLTVGNRQLLPIYHTGDSCLYTPNSIFHLKEVLRVPSVAVNLISVQKFAEDNDCVYIYDATGFSIQERTLGRTLFPGQSRMDYIHFQ